LGKGADLKPCGSLERGLILNLLALMKEASWCLRKGIDTATWALWDRGRIPGFFALVRVARSRPLCRLGKGRIPGPLAPRKGGATLPATLQICLKTNICNPLFSEGLQVGLRPLSGVPKAKGDQGGGVGGQKNLGAGGSAPKGFGWLYECGIARSRERRPALLQRPLRRSLATSCVVTLRGSNQLAAICARTNRGDQVMHIDVR